MLFKLKSESLNGIIFHNYASIFKDYSGPYVHYVDHTAGDKWKNAFSV